MNKVINKHKIDIQRMYYIVTVSFINIINVSLLGDLKVQIN